MNARGGVSVLAGVALLVAVFACDDGIGPSDNPTPGCATFEGYLHTLAVARPPGMALDAAVVGSHVFSLHGADGLFASDFSDPSNVRVVSGLGALTDARAIESSGPWLYLANGDDGLAVLDASDPSGVRVVRNVHMPGAVVDVRVQDDRAYLANDLLGLVIVDVSVPRDAHVLGVENTPGRVIGVAPSGTLAFVVSEPSELRIVNVADPASPFVITNLAVPGFVEAVDAADDLVAVAVGQAGVQLVDVSRPFAPVLSGLFNTPVNALHVALAGDVAFIADANGGALMVDVGNPDQPALIGTPGTVAFTHSVAVSGGRLVIADDIAGVRVLDITPTTPAPADSLVANGNIRSLSVMGDLVVVADASFGLHVIDPAARSVIGSFPMATSPKDVFVADSMAYVARQAGPIAIVDLHDPAAPVAAGEFGSGQETDHLVVAGSFGYLLDENGWLYEERISPPESGRLFRDSPVIWASITVAQQFPTGAVLYVPNARGTVLVIPAFRMTPISELPVSASPHRVAIQHYDGPSGPGTGTIAYVAETGFNNGQAGVEVFDVTDVNAPRLLGKFTCSGNAVDVAFAGDRVVVGEAEDGCEAFDLLGAARARPTGLLLAPVLRVAGSGGTLVAAAGKSGVLLVSLEDCLP